ncbi:hypothetical protein GF373_02400 [bacterium]|nr:hypothetical protein [bacterium]
MPPEAVQMLKLERLAKELLPKFKKHEAAEASFISTAHFSGFNPDFIYKVAEQFWPKGYAAKRKKNRPCFG